MLSGSHTLNLVCGQTKQRFFIHGILGLCPILGRWENERLIGKFDRWGRSYMLLRVLTALIVNHLGPLLGILPDVLIYIGLEVLRVFLDMMLGLSDEVVAFEG